MVTILLIISGWVGYEDHKFFGVQTGFRTKERSFYFVDPIAGRVVSADLWSPESLCGSSDPLTFVHFESPDVRTVFFCLPYTIALCTFAARTKIGK